MGDRLFGIETEYALAAIDARGGRVNQGQALDGLMRIARSRLPHLPDELSHGLFLQNASRFYVDSGGHPEFTTPECSNPWDVVRYIRAGESILLRLGDPLKYTRADVADVIQRAATLDDVLDALEASPSVSESTPSLYEWNRESADAPRASGGRQHNA